jgi:hypothetical protein
MHRAILLLVCSVACFSQRPSEPVPHPHRGLFAIWTNDMTPDLPFIQGGQVFLQWRTVEASEGHYDFTDLDRQLEAMHKRGRVATVQLNGNVHPDYLYTRVPYTQKPLSVQIRDKQGSLQYWHPAYVKAYTDLLAAYGRHVKASPYRSSVLGIRMNFNALGTEHVEIPPDQRDPSAWIVPAGVRPGRAWSPEVASAYQRTVMDAFVRNFAPEFLVFVRAEMGPQWIKLFETRTADLGLFHTSSEMEPRGKGGQFVSFGKFCRDSHAPCYAESWADAWGRHGGQTDARWCGPEQ